ncbi:hypothetical protein JAAARDRAFT_200558 [Jaapia argillacea MUCL 33604]|uniref:Uncharacterized protein n=1 Tax=Jaapia argillacea MUCL 33604 TaxID=933084 RepID=A0A067P4U8_9AGAM|nr:hypothetical protein JAAARDRAFT_200558 [Jaapia argillacea MUCL 33604]
MSAVQTVMSSADLLPIILQHMDTAFTFDTNGYMPKDLADIRKQVMGLSVVCWLWYEVSQELLV